jgi:putative iron-regulated protein
MNISRLVLLTALVVSAAACRRNADDETTLPVSELKAQILTDFSGHVAQATYAELKTAATRLHNDVLLLAANPDDAQLTQCKEDWRQCRMSWELSEAFLFGPVSSANIDPRIDTWPVNFTDLDSVLSSAAVFSQSYVDNLDDALKGFHPIEYLLFGLNGNKTAAQLTTRELEFLTALTENLGTLTAQLADSWNPSVQGNYSQPFTTAGNGSSVYATKRMAYEEVVNAMIGICDEVANGKMNEPFVAQDPSLEESPFAFNSITDFTNNIGGVRNVYLGKYTSDGKGIEDLVREGNLSLDGQVKQAIDNAQASLNAITIPFGQAIIQQPVQVQNAINSINNLKAVLENDLLPYVQLHTN